MTDFADLNLTINTDNSTAADIIWYVYNSYATVNPNTDTYAEGTFTNATDVIFYTSAAEFKQATGQDVDPSKNAGYTSRYGGQPGTTISIWIDPALFLGVADADKLKSVQDAIFHELFHVAYNALGEGDLIHAPEFYIALEAAAQSAGIAISGFLGISSTKVFLITIPGENGAPDRVYKGTQFEVAIMMALEKGEPPLTATEWGLLEGLIGPMGLVVIAAKLGNANDPAFEAAFRSAYTQTTGNQIPENCFLVGTPIELWDGSQTPIESIRAGDIVKSYDKYGDIVAGRVVQTFTNSVRHVLDWFGLGITPGHVTLSGDGRYAGRHVPMIDILRSDGALVKEDGSLVRAATGCPVGSYEDGFVSLIVGQRAASGDMEVVAEGQVRIGTRFVLSDGKDVSIADLLKDAGAQVRSDGLIECEAMLTPSPLHLTFLNALPKPEDYVLQRSGITLADIRSAGEWEGVAAANTLGIREQRQTH